MKCTFFIGKTKSGKSSVANKFKKDHPECIVYEAGQWAYELFEKTDGMTTYDREDPVIRTRITQLATAKLRENNRHSVEYFNEWLAHQLLQGDIHVVIVGIRNPEDFFYISTMLNRMNCEQHVMFLQSPDQREQDVFDNGVGAIIQYVKWRSEILRNISYEEVYFDKDRFYAD